MKKSKKVFLFYTIKINTSDIINNNYYIKSSFDSLRKNNKIVSIGDNQILRFIRNINEIDFNKEKIYNLEREKNELKKIDSSKKNSKLIIDIQNKINEELFVPDLISVKCDTTKKDYKDICKNGFIIDVSINKKQYIIKYKRLCAGAGQLRKNTAMFVNESLYDSLYSIMMCGLSKERIGKINLAKFNAYFSLYSSAINRVRTPRICVVNDFEYELKNQNVTWVYPISNGEFDIENKNININMNAFDGAGIISPEMAEFWKNDLNLEYLPASFIIRAPFIKGLVSIFDFKKFAKEIAHTEYIKDIYGIEYKVEDIDIILTASQFKLYKKYQNFQEYMYFFKKYNHIFGVTRVTKENNDIMTTLNYQYIQTNNFTEDSIKLLADYTLNYLKKIMNGERLYAILLLNGKNDFGSKIEDIENNSNSYISKAIMYNEDILNDSYIRKKISKTIEKKIKQAKIGKLYVEGSYDFAIPDLYALAEHAFGMEVNGLLNAGQCWNKRWVDKGADVVTLMRSPLVAPGENRKLNIYSDCKCLEWFKYIYSGNIYNIWDTTIIAQSDADK